MISSRGREGAGAQSVEASYTGPLGATRRETAFVPSREGPLRRVEVVRTVNAVSDPGLATRAVEGTLHRAGEFDLAVPFVYHDPAARRMALVVPHALCHEELVLRAEWLKKLASDTTEALPGYVREARTVLGTAGLRRYLEEPRGGGGDPRVEALTQREERLHKLSQEIARKQDELDALQGDLAQREAELEQRLSELLHREESLAQDEHLMRANMAALASREKLMSVREEATPRAPSTPPPAPMVARKSVPPAMPTVKVEATATDDDVLSLDNVEDIEPEEHTGRLAALQSPPTPIEGHEGAQEELSPDEVAMVAEEALAPHDEVAEALEPEPEVEGPAQWVARDGRALAAVVDAEVRVWFQGSGQTFATGGVTPVLQCDPDAGEPLALLSLQRDESGEALVRVVLDATLSDHRAVVEALGRSFRVRAERVSATGRSLETYIFGAPCEALAQQVGTLLEARKSPGEEALAAAKERLFSQGVVWRDADPRPLLLGDEQNMSSAQAVADALVAYEPFLDRERLERVCVATGVPQAQIEALGRRLVLAALRCGVVLSPSLTRRAVESGLAADERALAGRALTAFARTVEAGLDAIGRSPLDASRAWALLLTWADRSGAAIPDNVRDAIASVYDPDEPASIAPPDPRPQPRRDEIASLDDATLSTWVEHPKLGPSAAMELARRDGLKHQAALRRALLALPAHEAAQVAAELLVHGDALGDLWVELLGTRRTTLQNIAVAAAGALKLRRTLTALCQRATSPDRDAWRLAGWAAGESGAAVVRAASRLDNPDPERLAWALAHAIRQGASREIERAKAEGGAAYVEAASRALSMQDEVKAYDAALRRGEGATAIEQLVAPLLRARTSPSE